MDVIVLMTQSQGEVFQILQKLFCILQNTEAFYKISLEVEPHDFLGVLSYYFASEVVFDVLFFCLQQKKVFL